MIVSDKKYHNIVGKKILYTYVYHIVGYLILLGTIVGNCEALHEIMDLVDLSVCAP